MDVLFDIFKLVAAVGGIVFGIVKWILEQNKKNELKEMYEVRLKEKDERCEKEKKLYEKILKEREQRIDDLLKKKKKLEKIVGE